jgi:tetratricopeptide (TPR) repeat protein
MTGEPALISDALGSLASYLLNMCLTAGVRPVLEEAMEYAIRVQDRHGIMGVKGVMAELEQAEGKYEEALRLFQELLAFSREPPGVGPWALAWTCFKMGRVECLMGDLAAMRAHYIEALQVFQRVGSPGNVLMALEHIVVEEYRALSAPTKQEAERAARLLEAIERKRDRRVFISNYPIYLVYHDSVLRLRDRIRSVLGEKAFARAISEGAAMTLEQAVKYALQDPALGK